MKFWPWKKKEEPLLATNHEIIAGDICVQLGHLSDHAKIEILKLVVSRLLPKMCIGFKPYQRNPKQGQTQIAA